MRYPNFSFDRKKKSRLLSKQVLLVAGRASSEEARAELFDSRIRDGLVNREISLEAHEIEGGKSAWRGHASIICGLGDAKTMMNKIKSRRGKYMMIKVVRHRHHFKIDMEPFQ